MQIVDRVDLPSRADSNYEMYNSRELRYYANTLTSHILILVPRTITDIIEYECGFIRERCAANVNSCVIYIN